MHLKLLLLICTTPLLMKGQPNRIGVEATTNYPINSHLTNLNKGFNLFIQSNHHEGYFGLDFLGSGTLKFYGLEAGYKYYLGTLEKKHHFFIESNNQWLKWGTGMAMDVPYDYIDNPSSGYRINLYQNKSFISSILFGFEWKPAKWMSLYPAIGPGISLYSVKGGDNYFGKITNENHTDFVFTLKLAARLFYQKNTTN